MGKKKNKNQDVKINADKDSALEGNELDSINENHKEYTENAEFSPGPLWHTAVLSIIFVVLILIYKIYFTFFAT